MDLQVVKEFALGDIKALLAYPAQMVRFVSYPVWMSLTILLWSILYAHAEFPMPFKEAIQYLLMSQLLAIGANRWIGRIVSRNINMGKIGIYLARPLNPSDVWRGRAYQRLTDIMVGMPFFLLVGVLLGFKLDNLWFALLIFLIGFLAMIEFWIGLGLLAFWVEESWGIQSGVQAFVSFFAGTWVPLYFLPSWAQGISGLMPFQLVGHIPSSIALGRIHPDLGLVVFALAWLGIMWMFRELIWRLGLSKLTAHGI